MEATSQTSWALCGRPLAASRCAGAHLEVECTYVCLCVCVCVRACVRACKKAAVAVETAPYLGRARGCRCHRIAFLYLSCSANVLPNLGAVLQVAAYGSSGSQPLLCLHQNPWPLVQGEMQEALKAVDLGVAAAKQEHEQALRAGSDAAALRASTEGAADHQGAASPGGGSANGVGPAAAAGGSTGGAQGSPLLKGRLRQTPRSPQQTNGLASGTGDSGSGSGGQSLREAQEESCFAGVVGEFLENAQNQKAALGELAEQTYQSITKLAVLLGEPPASEAAQLFAQTLSFADAFDRAAAALCRTLEKQSKN